MINPQIPKELCNAMMGMMPHDRIPQGFYNQIVVGFSKVGKNYVLTSKNGGTQNRAELPFRPVPRRSPTP